MQNWTRSKFQWPFDITAISSEGSHYLKNGNQIKHVKTGGNNTVEVTFSKPIANVSELELFSGVKSYICNVQIFSIETEDNCEEPDSPLYGQHVWNRNDSVATFQCDDNFNLTSNLPLECVGGKWIGSLPKCKLF